MDCVGADNQSMHILISCVGSAGDVHPFVAIGQTLLRHGHSVELLASPHFKVRIEDAGLSFAPFGTEADYQRIVNRADLWHRYRSFEVLWREMQPRLVEAHDALVARVQPGRTVLVGSTLAWHVRLAQETQRLPAATVHLSPMCIFSAQAPARLPGLPDLTGWPVGAVRWVMRGLERVYLDRIVAPGLDAIRKQLGLAPVRHVLSEWVHSPQSVLCAWPNWFAPPQSDWPSQARTTGFPLWPAASGSALNADLLRFLETGPAPIGFTPGSAMAHGRDFFERALAASRRLGHRALLITPYADQLPETLPSYAHAVGYAPFDLLLPRLAALVHHAGIGTTAQALAAGKPQGVMPFAHDQLDNATRIEGLGVGLRLDRRRGSVDWANRLDRLLNDPRIAAACQQHAMLMADEPDAPGQIAEAIEALAIGSDQVVDAGAASQAIFNRPPLRLASSTSVQSPGSV